MFPVTKEFREKLYGEFERTYQAEKSKGKSETKPDKEADRAPAKTGKKDKTEKEPEPAVAR